MAERPSTDLPGHAVLGHSGRPGVLLEEKQVGLVVDDGRDLDEGKHQAQPQQGTQPSQGRPLEAEVAPGAHQDKAASQVDQALDELEGGHHQGRGAQGQGDEAVAEAQGGRHDFDLALEVLSAPDLQGHKEGVGQGLQPQPEAQHKHDLFEGPGVALPLHEAHYPHERQDQQDPLEEGHLGQGGVRIPVLVGQEGHQGQVEAEFRHQQQDAPQTHGQHKLPVGGGTDPGQIDEENRLQSLPDPTGAEQVGKLLEDAGRSGLFRNWRAGVAYEHQGTGVGLKVDFLKPGAPHQRACRNYFLGVSA